jgi:hypothetical protein
MHHDVAARGKGVDAAVRGHEDLFRIQPQPVKLGSRFVKMAQSRSQGWYCRVIQSAGQSGLT